MDKKQQEAINQELLESFMEIPEVFSSITNYLIDKSTGSIRDPESYPIDVVADGRLRRGFILDAESRGAEGGYQLDIIVLADGTKYHLRKQCLAPVGSQLDWDNIHCSIDVIHRREV